MTVPPTNSGAWGVAIVGNFIFPHHAAPLGFLRVFLPSITSGRMPICGNLAFPPNHVASLASQASLPINYFWEDAHPWEILPPAISPSGYPSWLPVTPPLFTPFMYAPIYSQYI